MGNVGLGSKELWSGWVNQDQCLPHWHHPQTNSTTDTSPFWCIGWVLGVIFAFWLHVLHTEWYIYCTALWDGNWAHIHETEQLAAPRSRRALLRVPRLFTVSPWLLSTKMTCEVKIMTWNVNGLLGSNVGQFYERPNASAQTYSSDRKHTK